MQERILVLGATGNVGAPLVENLIAAGYQVRATGRKRPAGLLPHQKLDWMSFDFGSPSTFAAAFRGIDRVFLLTPVVPQTAELTAELVRCARDAGVKRIIKLSAQGVDREPPMTFALWHREAERAVTESGIPSTFLRPTGFMQNFINSFATSIKHQGAFYSPLGQARVAYIDARDIAEVASVALTEEGHTGKTYDLTGPTALSGDEVARVLSEEIGRNIRYVPVSPTDAERSMKGNGMPDFLVRGILDLYDAYVQGEGEKVSPAVAQVLGRAPRSFDQFVRDHRNAFV